jgi:hypothetical protein
MGCILKRMGYRLDPMYDYYRLWEPIRRTLLREEGEHWQHEQEGSDLTAANSLTMSGFSYRQELYEKLLWWSMSRLKLQNAIAIDDPDICF